LPSFRGFVLPRFGDRSNNRGHTRNERLLPVP
jgi:hypothetical protein